MGTTACAIEMDNDSDECSKLPSGYTTDTYFSSGISVIKRSKVPPRAWVGLMITVNTITFHGCRTQPFRMMAIQITHKHVNDARTSSTCMADMDVIVKMRKSEHLGQGCNRLNTKKFCLGTQTRNTSIFYQPHTYFGKFLTRTYAWAWVQQVGATNSRNQKLRHASPVRDEGLGAQQYIVLRQGHCQVTEVPVKALQITAEYSADIGNRRPVARVSLCSC